MTNIFDSYLIVDWSALRMPSPARPSRDAIWVGEGHWQAEGLVSSESYWRTRYACEEYLIACLQELARSGRRILLGCDFVYGYPERFGEGCFPAKGSRQEDTEARAGAQVFPLVALPGHAGSGAGGRERGQ